MEKNNPRYKEYLSPVDEEDYNDFYYNYRNILNLMKDLKALNIDIEKPLDYENFIKALDLIKTTYTMANIGEFDNIADYLAYANITPNIEVTYIDDIKADK